MENTQIEMRAPSKPRKETMRRILSEGVGMGCQGLRPIWKREVPATSAWNGST